MMSVVQVYTLAYGTNRPSEWTDIQSLGKDFAKYWQFALNYA